MADQPSDPNVSRIERALARIEAAASSRAYAADQLARRHAVLRGRIEAAIVALDRLAEAADGELDPDDAEDAD
jgi:hypothetical protein